MRRVPVIALALGLSLAAAPESQGAAPASSSPATYQRYVDDDGIVHVTNVARKANDPWKPAPGIPGSAGERPSWGVPDGRDAASAGAGATPGDRAVVRDPLGGVVGDPARFDEFIESASQRYQIPQALIRAVVHTESRYQPNAVSHVGAMGLMQLMPATARYLGVAQPFDPLQNIHGGTKYLRLLANMFNGDMVLVLAAYFSGAGSVKKYAGVPPHPGVRRYVKAVLRRYYAYERRTQQSGPPQPTRPARQILGDDGGL